MLISRKRVSAETVHFKILKQPVYQFILLASFLTLWSWFSARWAVDAAAARQHALRSAQFLVAFVCLWRLLPRVIGRMLIVTHTLLQGTVALLQFHNQQHLGLDWLGEVAATPTGGYSIIVVDQTLWLRSYGLTPHPNILGGILAISFLILSGYLIEGWQKTITSVALLIGGAGLFFTFSRAAWLGFLVGLVVLGMGLRRGKLVHFRRATVWSITIALGLGCAILINSQRDLLATRLNPNSHTTEMVSVTERQLQFSVAVDLISQHPLKGVGASNFVAAADPILGSIDGALPAHNVLLLVLSELGLFGGLLWLMMVLIPLIYLWQQQPTVAGMAVFAGLLALLIIEQFDMYTWMWGYGRTLRCALWIAWAQVQWPLEFTK